MSDIIRLEKKEDGTVVGLFERALSDNELIQAKEKFEELNTEYGKLLVQIDSMKVKLEAYEGVFDLAVEDVVEELVEEVENIEN